MTRKPQKVICLMSGGVDSSVTCFLLKKRGFNVIGVFMYFWSEPIKDVPAITNKCCTLEARDDAFRVARSLMIPFYTFDLRKEFKKRVVDYFLKEYRDLRTPNPCVVCNHEIKFGLMLEKALLLGADLIASGHYARKKLMREGAKIFFELRRAKDKLKDQSYFLYYLDQSRLKYILFPLAEYKKTKVKEIAKKVNLPVAERNESQEACFFPEEKPTEFLKRNLDLRPGPIKDKEGREIGRHAGLPLYTIGQRAGLKIGGGRPFFVIDKEKRNDTLIVSNDLKDLCETEFFVRSGRWTRGREPQLPLTCKVQIRYRQKPLTCQVKKRKGGLKVELKKPVSAITPGQSAVFYKKDIVLGGGVIV